MSGTLQPTGGSPVSEASRGRYFETLAPLVGALSLLLFGVFLFRDFVADDAYITFRYSKNLASGLGPVFNPGERVEGYTNFLWMLLMTPAFALGTDPATWARVLGVASAAATLCLLWRASAPVVGQAMGPWTAMLATAFAGVPLYAVSGLETPLFMLLVTGGVLALAAELAASDESEPPAASGPAGRAAWCWATPELLLWLAALCRPEGLWFLLAGGAVRFASTPRKAWRVGPFAVAIAGYAALLVCRYAYYGDWVPNTFHAKVGLTMDQVWRGIKDVAQFSRAGVFHLVTILAVAGMAGGCRQPAVRLTGLVSIPYVAYTALVGGDNYPLNRFVVAVVPLLALLAVRGLTCLAALPGLSGQNGMQRMRLMVCLLAVFWFLCSSLPAMDEVASLIYFIEVCHGFGDWLHGWADPHWVMALCSIGAAPYYSELVAIDMLGLTDRTVALTPAARMGTGLAGHEKSNANYILSRSPDLIYFGFDLLEPPPGDLRHLPAEKFVGNRHGVEPALADMWHHPVFLRDYVQRYVPVRGRFLTFYVRSKSPAAARPCL